MYITLSGAGSDEIGWKNNPEHSWPSSSASQSLPPSLSSSHQAPPPAPPTLSSVSNHLSADSSPVNSYDNLPGLLDKLGLSKYHNLFQVLVLFKYFYYYLFIIFIILEE